MGDVPFTYYRILEFQYSSVWDRGHVLPVSYIKKNNLKFKTSICTKTLYRYIDKGLFLHITNKNLHNRSKQKQKKKKVKTIKRVTKGNSIEQRPKSVLTREEFGHWEYDTVIGKKKKGEVAYVFTERKTNMEFIIKGKDKTALSAVFAIDKLERQFGNLFSKVFKSITCDNGTEFFRYNGFFGDIRTVDVTVSRLREKIENDPAKPEYLLTKRGVGYYINN